MFVCLWNWEGRTEEYGGEDGEEALAADVEGVVADAGGYVGVEADDAHGGAPAKSKKMVNLSRDILGLPNRWSWRSADLHVNF